jgi:hypothetical protein
MRRLALIAALIAPMACARYQVTRVVDGQIMLGEVIAPEAYASFLRGAIAEEARDFPRALAAYEDTGRLDSENPEVWTRIASVRCAINPRDSGARWAAARALALDPDYAPAWTARAKCELARGEDRVSVERDALRAADDEPRAVEPQVELALIEDKHPVMSESARNRLVGLTLAHAASAVAWDALAAWAKGHGDAILRARAYSEVARYAPLRRAALAEEVKLLAGEGELPAARMLAGALVDAPAWGDRSSGGQGTPPAAIPLVARLAVDEAILAGNVERVRRRATAAHLGLDEVGGRALLLDMPSMAQEIVAPLAAGDPGSVGARLVLAVAAYDLRDSAGVARALTVSAGSHSPAIAPVETAASALLPFVRLVARALSARDARTVFDAMVCAPLVEGDPLVVPIAVDLAARGAMNATALPPDGLIELAIRTHVRLPVRSPDQDARHTLLALAWEKPEAPETQRLLHHLAPAVGRDPLVTVAAARIALAEGNIADGTIARLLALGPLDPILVATALELAEKRGDSAMSANLRGRLGASGAAQASSAPRGM